MFDKRIMLGVLAIIFALSSWVILTASDDISSFCIVPTDDEFIELAITEIVGDQTAGVSGLHSQGQSNDLQLAPFPNKQSYLEANPECCMIFTKQAIAEYVSPEQRTRTNYAGSVRVRTTYQVIANSNPDYYSRRTYSNTRIVHIDKCGQIINL